MGLVCPPQDSNLEFLNPPRTEIGISIYPPYDKSLSQDAELFSPPHCWTGKEKDPTPLLWTKFLVHPLGTGITKGLAPLGQINFLIHPL